MSNYHLIQIINVKRIILNTEPGFAYEESSIKNDIAILKLSLPLKFNKQVQPACLPPKTWFPKDGKEDCYVSGWGALAVPPNGPIPYPEELQWLKQNIIANEKCQNLWYKYTIHDSNICGMHKDGIGKAPCFGDSGGSLVCGDDKNKAVITGIVSYGQEKCVGKALPEVYTRVTHYLSWIQKNMENTWSRIF